MAGSDQPASVMSMYDPDAFLVTHQLPLSGGEEDSASPVEYQPASKDYYFDLFIYIFEICI